MRKKEVGWRDVNEDGDKIEVMAVRDGHGYHFRYMLIKDEEWVDIPKPTLELLEKLHEIMDLRYRRRRASFKEIQIIEKMIKALG